MFTATRHLTYNQTKYINLTATDTHFPHILSIFLKFTLFVFGSTAPQSDDWSHGIKSQHRGVYHIGKVPLAGVVGEIVKVSTTSRHDK